MQLSILHWGMLQFISKAQARMTASSLVVDRGHGSAVQVTEHTLCLHRDVYAETDRLR
jgi:hypothetical protein